MANEHTVNHVRPLLHYFIQRVLPLVYDDSLSYYEVLSKVIAKLNELIEQNNTIADEIVRVFTEWMESPEGQAAIEEAIGQSVGDITERLAQAEADIDSLQADLPALAASVASAQQAAGQAQQTASTAQQTANTANSAAQQASRDAGAASEDALTAQQAAATAQQGVNLLQGRMASVDQSLDQQGQQITAVNSDLTTARRDISAASARIDALTRVLNPMQTYNADAHAVFLGDSWTAGVAGLSENQLYWYRLCYALNMTAHNYGIGAAGFAKRPLKIVTGVTNAVAGMTTTERDRTALVFIMGGVNDYRHASEDNLTYEEFRAAVIDCLRQAHSAFPNALIVTAIGNCIQHGTNPTYINWFINTNRALSRLSFPVLVIDNMFDIVANTAAYFSDALHPTSTGHEYILKAIMGALTGAGTNVQQFVTGSFLNDQVASQTGGGYMYLWRFGRKFILTPALLHFNQDLSSLTQIGALPSYVAPQVNIYGGFYYGNRRVGSVVVTNSGALYVNPEGAITQGYPQQLEWLAY